MHTISMAAFAFEMGFFPIPVRDAPIQGCDPLLWMGGIPGRMGVTPIWKGAVPIRMATAPT